MACGLTCEVPGQKLNQFNVMTLNQRGKIIGFEKSNQRKGISYFFHPTFNLNPMIW